MLCWLFSQVLALPLLVHHRHRALQAMDHSRQLVRHNGLKVLALLGLLIGINLLGLIGASLVLLFSLPFSADPDGLLPNSNAMQERFPPKHVAHVNAGDLPGLNPVLHQEAR